MTALRSAGTNGRESESTLQLSGVRALGVVLARTRDTSLALPRMRTLCRDDPPGRFSLDRGLEACAKSASVGCATLDRRGCEKEFDEQKLLVDTLADDIARDSAMVTLIAREMRRARECAR